MELVPTLAPQPLPKNPAPTKGVGTPKEWKDKVLVSLAFQTPAAKTPFVEYGRARHFERTPGSFQTAVEIASARARGEFAHAVLQAADGSYYIAALYNQDGSGVTIDTQLATGVKFIDGIRENDAVRAIVGAANWVNFTAEPVAPKLAR
jgi:hypothetical protein